MHAWTNRTGTTECFLRSSPVNFPFSSRPMFTSGLFLPDICTTNHSGNTNVFTPTGGASSESSRAGGILSSTRGSFSRFATLVARRCSWTTVSAPIHPSRPEITTDCFGRSTIAPGP